MVACDENHVLVKNLRLIRHGSIEWPHVQHKNETCNGKELEDPHLHKCRLTRHLSVSRHHTHGHDAISAQKEDCVVEK